MAIFGLWKDPKTYFWGARISISGSTYLSFGKHGEKYPDFEVDCDLLYGPENTSDHYEVFKTLPHTESTRQQIDAPGLVEHAKRLSSFLDKPDRTEDFYVDVMNFVGMQSHVLDELDEVLRAHSRELAQTNHPSGQKLSTPKPVTRATGNPTEQFFTEES